MKRLEEKEHYINKYINEIEKVFIGGNNEDVMLIEQIINDRKKYNKVQKLFEAKQIQEEIRMKKNLKTINTNRIVIRGRKVIQDFPLIRGQRKKKKIAVKKDNEELDYLYYSSDEN
jgi:predicted patatin/cPLA2 family phospholipase